MACTATKLLTSAVKELGYKESPKNSNNTKYGEWYGLNGQPWCAMFVSWCANQNNALDIIPKHAYTPSGYKWFKSRNQIVTSGYKAGDIVYFKFSGTRIHHVGIVESVRANGDLVTIEGNTSATSDDNGGVVMRRVRNPKYVVGAGRPKYISEAPKVVRAKVNTNGGNLNLRSEPSAKSKVLAKIPNGTGVIVLYRGPQWTKIAYKKIIGYGATRFLKF